MIGDHEMYSCTTKPGIMQKSKTSAGTYFPKTPERHYLSLLAVTHLQSSSSLETKRSLVKLTTIFTCTGSKDVTVVRHFTHEASKSGGQFGPVENLGSKVININRTQETATWAKYDK